MFARSTRLDRRPRAVQRIRGISFLTLLLICGSVGCRAIESYQRHFIQGPIKCYRDAVWAKRAFNMRYGNCGRAYGDHFERGFIDGYCSVCEGNDGFVPAMPPDEYWGNEYQTGDGAQCVNAWFEGYPAGAAAAKQDKAGKFNDIYVSKMMQAALSQESAPNVLPDDVPVVQPESAEESTPPAPLDEAANRSIDPRMVLPGGVMPVGWENDVRYQR